MTPPRRVLRRTAPVLAAVLLAGAVAGCEKQASQAATATKEWKAWVADHPVTGAEVTSYSGDGTTAYVDRFEVTAKVAKPSAERIESVLGQLCDFDDEATVEVAPTLVAGPLTVTADCRAGSAQRIARTFTTVTAAPGLGKAVLTRQRQSATATGDADLARVSRAVLEGFSISRRVPEGATVEVRSPKRSVRVVFDNEVTLGRAGLRTLLANDAGRTTSVEVGDRRITATGTLDVRAATDLQRATLLGSPAGLDVRVTPTVPSLPDSVSTGNRRIVKTVSGIDGVSSVQVDGAGWIVDATSPTALQQAFKTATSDPVTRELGVMTLTLQGTRSCAARYVPASLSPGSTALQLRMCALDNAVSVVAGDPVSITLRGSAVKPVVQILQPSRLTGTFRLTTVDGTGKPTGDATFTIGEFHRVLDGSDPALGSSIDRIWDSLPPVDFRPKKYREF